MKLSLLKENIEDGLGIIERITPKSHTLPILGNVLLETEKNFLKLSVTDLNLAVRYWIIGKIENQGKITIPAKVFADSIRIFPEEKISIEATQNTLTIIGEYGKTKILGQPPDDFPLIPPIPKEDSFLVDCVSFCEMLSSVIDFTASPSSSRVELTGVYIKAHPKGMTLVATDSFRLAEKQFLFSPGEEKFPSKEYTFLVPQKILREILSFASEKEGKIEISLSRNQIGLEYKKEGVLGARVQFLSRLLEGEFPPYQEIIPEAQDAQIIVPKEKFVQFLKGASVMSPKTNEIVLHISPHKKGVEITSESPDKGEYHSFLSADCTGEELDIHFNWRFLLGGLMRIKSTDIVFMVQKNEKPAVLKPRGDTSFIYVVMPMRPS